MCETCERLKRKTMTVDAWLAEHRDHGDLSSEPFPHPSGDWHTLVCSCGAKLVTMKPLTARPDQFHDHLDGCRQCADQPFNLCPVGMKLLVSATG
jgi:hypothetical protein